MAIKLSYTGEEYAPKRFLEIVEKRVRKRVREAGQIVHGETVSLLKSDSKEFFVAKYLLEQIFGGKITIRETDAINRHGKTIVPWSLDRKVAAQLNLFFEDVFEQKNANIVFFPDNVLEEEIIEICKLKGFAWEKDSRNKVYDFINKLEAMYPGVKFSLLKSFDKLP